MTDVFISVPNPITIEGSSFNVTAYFRDSSNAAEAPTTSKYRIDCLSTGKELLDWTTLTPAVSNSIAITATYNAIQNSSNTTEKKQITVAANPGGATQTRDVAIWLTENVSGVDTTSS